MLFQFLHIGIAVVPMNCFALRFPLESVLPLSRLFSLCSSTFSIDSLSLVEATNFAEKAVCAFLQSYPA
jgi:hypothetical protein